MGDRRHRDPMNTALASFVMAVALYMYTLQQGFDPKIRAVTKILPIMVLYYFVGPLSRIERGNKNGKFVDAFAKYMKIGILFCAGGDVFLELQELDGFDFLFIFGLASFLIGHVWYIVAFRTCGKIRAKYSLPCIAFAIGMILVLFPHLDDDLVIPVCVYAFAISFMGTSALSRTPAFDNSTPSFSASRLRGIVGAFVFIVSDTTIAVDKFMAPIPYAKYFIMVTYYLAQYFIATSVYMAFPTKNIDK